MAGVGAIRLAWPTRRRSGRGSAAGSELDRSRGPCVRLTEVVQVSIVDVRRQVSGSAVDQGSLVGGVVDSAYRPQMSKAAAGDLCHDGSGVEGRHPAERLATRLQHREEPTLSRCRLKRGLRTIRGRDVEVLTREVLDLSNLGTNGSYATHPASRKPATPSNAAVRTRNPGPMVER